VEVRTGKVSPRADRASALGCRQRRTRAKLDVGPLPRAATATRSAPPAAPTIRLGGSLKIIADTEDWDKSVGLNTPGQSGDPDSPHYRDLFQLWARDDISRSPTRGESRIRA
jgi:penicillin amidase